MKGVRMKKVLVAIFAVMFVLSAVPSFAAFEMKGAVAPAVQQAGNESALDKVGDWFATRGKTPEEKTVILNQRRADRAVKEAEKMAKQAQKDMEKMAAEAKKKAEQFGKDVKKGF